MGPVYLPAQVPNLLVNGSAGIAVGMATNIPPHNLNEVINAVIHCINKPGYRCRTGGTAPRADFPTGALFTERAESLKPTRPVVVRCDEHVPPSRSRRVATRG